MFRLALATLALTAAAPLRAADPFVFQDGDRVVLLGSTVIEREQQSGYWELALTLKNRDKNVVFRNLGWSGDTVFGEARNGFDASPKGFERLVSLTLELKPTVVVVCYGHNESFAGKDGVPGFTAGLEKLLGALAPAKARVVLMSPTPFENAGPVKDAEAKNANLALYRDAIRGVAEKRHLEFVDLFEKVSLWAVARDSAGPATLTENGFHYGPAGYQATAPLLTGDQGAPSTSATEDLRTRIVEKNELFFHRWRPQNQTYLFGFRKHEQGQNAKEVAQFDPLVAAAEKEIARLKKK